MQPKRGRKPSSLCRLCGAEREKGRKEALCRPCHLRTNQERCRKWREEHPDRYRASEAKRARPDRKPRVAKPKPVKPVIVRRRPVVQPDIVIGPQAFQRPQPVDIRGHRVTRVPAGVSGWGR